MGPIPESQKNKYKMLIGDQFSERCEIVALPNQEAKSMARASVEHWIVRLGSPDNLHYDQGLKFMSKLFPSLCAAPGQKKTSNLPPARERID